MSYDKSETTSGMIHSTAIDSKIPSRDKKRSLYNSARICLLRFARRTRDESVIIVHKNFVNLIHAHTAQLYSGAETHELTLGLKVRRGERER